jgi:hypothetical protein
MPFAGGWGEVVEAVTLGSGEFDAIGGGFSSTRATRRAQGIGARSVPRVRIQARAVGHCTDLGADRADLVDDPEVALEVLTGFAVDCRRRRRQFERRPTSAQIVTQRRRWDR